MFGRYAKLANTLGEITLTHVLKIPAILILVSSAIFAAEYYLIHQHQWVPFTVPIPLTPGEFTSPRFTVDSDIEYQLKIEVDRTIPYERLKCLLGAEVFYPEHYKETPSVVEISWTVFDEDGSKKDGSSNNSRGIGGTSQTLERPIGNFLGKRNHWYHIGLTLLKDARALAETKPRLVVAEDFHRFTGNVTIVQILSIPALISGCIGIVWLLVIFVGRLWTMWRG